MNVYTWSSVDLFNFWDLKEVERWGTKLLYVGVPEQSFQHVREEMEMEKQWRLLRQEDVFA